MRRFLVTCDDCDWRQTLTTEPDANRVAAGHARVHADTPDLDSFVAANVSLAHFHAVRAHRMHQESYADVYADALVGLWDAARRWDPARGANFSTFARHRITGQIADGRRERDPLSRTLRHRGDVPNPLSLDSSLTDGQTLADLIPGNDPIAEWHDDLERTERHDALMTAIDTLPPRVAYVIRQQLAGRTLAAIAVDLDVTESRTCQMRHDAIHRLRALIAA